MVHSSWFIVHANTKPEIPNPKSEIANLKSQISNPKSQIHKSQIHSYQFQIPFLLVNHSTYQPINPLLRSQRLNRLCHGSLDRLEAYGYQRNYNSNESRTHKYNRADIDMIFIFL